MLQPTQLHEDEFLRVLWDEELLVIGIDRKEATAAMTDKDFRAELTLFVGYVEEKKARGILVDVSKFRHQMAPDAQQWRVKNISTRCCWRQAIRVSLSEGRPDSTDDEAIIAGRKLPHTG